jgi:hypothetical protein
MAEPLRHLTYGTILSPWIIGPVVYIHWPLILLPAKRRFLNLVRGGLAKHNTPTWADALIEAMSLALTVAIWVAGLAILDRILPLSTRADRVVGIILAGGVTLALTIFIDSIGLPIACCSISRSGLRRGKERTRHSRLSITLLHRQARRRPSKRLRAEPGRWHHSRTLSGIVKRASSYGSGQAVSIHD